MGAPPVPGRPDRPPSDDPGGIAEAPPSSPPGGPPPGDSGPGPGPSGEPATDPPPSGDPPGRTPDPPPPPAGTPPPDPESPPGGLPPEDPPGQPPPPPEEPPGQPPPPPPEPPKGGGDPPPGPKDDGETPEPEDPQRPLKQETPGENTSPILNPVDSILQTTSLSIVGAYSGASDWTVDGTFSVNGLRSSGEVCCIQRELSKVSFSDAGGFGARVQWLGFETAIVVFQDVRGKSEAIVSNCSSATGEFSELATIDVNIDLQVYLGARLPVVSLGIGGLNTSLGVQGGVYFNRLEVGNGSSASTSFDINESFYGFGALCGPYAGLDLNVGPIKLDLSVELPLLVTGTAAQPDGVYFVTLGLGSEF